uniref:Uncharacterized protein n=1 Tax=Cacopsylla melanoneura TaxID=428564 RepID=A0A8D9A021_9HEMI
MSPKRNGALIPTAVTPPRGHPSQMLRLKVCPIVKRFPLAQQVVNQSQWCRKWNWEAVSRSLRNQLTHRNQFHRRNRIRVEKEAYSNPAPHPVVKPRNVSRCTSTSGWMRSKTLWLGIRISLTLRLERDMKRSRQWTRQ